jgi:hypothetical protein
MYLSSIVANKGILTYKEKWRNIRTVFIRSFRSI